MEQVLAHVNMKAALGRVKRNRGGPGVDGMTVDELLPYIWEHLERIKSSLLDGTYKPSPVKGQEIPGSGGGIRELGIPTVLDRLIQQSLLQVLQPQFNPAFSDHSYGFRPGRSAHGVIRASQKDHVPMGMTAARKVRLFLVNTERILEIGLLCAAQASKFHSVILAGAGAGAEAEDEAGDEAAAVRVRLRSQVQPLREDRFLAPDLEAAWALVADGRRSDPPHPGQLRL
jgi:hypothetical protein